MRRVERWVVRRSGAAVRFVKRGWWRRVVWERRG